MIHVGRIESDDRAPRMVWRPFERWERIARGEAADRLVMWALAAHRADRLPKALGLHDVRWLDRWVDRVYTASHGGVSPAGIGADGTITPVDIFSGDSTFQSWHRSDIGVTTSTGLSQWRAAYGGHPTWTASQATGGLQPTVATNDATLFGRTTFTGDAVDDYMNTGFNPPPPATTNFYIRSISKQITWAGGRSCFAGSSVSFLILRGTNVSPNVGLRNSTSAGIVSMALNTWFRTETMMRGAADDWLRIGNNQASSLSAGNVDVSVLALFGSSAGANGNFALAEFLTCTAEPSAAKRALLDGLEAGWYLNTVTQG